MFFFLFSNLFYYSCNDSVHEDGPALVDGLALVHGPALVDAPALVDGPPCRACRSSSNVVRKTFTVDLVLADCVLKTAQAKKSHNIIACRGTLRPKTMKTLNHALIASVDVSVLNSFLLPIHNRYGPILFGSAKQSMCAWILSAST